MFDDDAFSKKRASINNLPTPKQKKFDKVNDPGMNRDGKNDEFLRYFLT